MTTVSSSHTLTDPVAVHLVKELQDERSALWSMYCEIAALKPFDSSVEVRPILSAFSQLLIDYVSLGHFGVFDRVINGCQQASLNFANRLYPALSETTATALSFNDHYDNVRRPLKVEHLSEDLSKLGETLAQRMEIEDKLCSLLLH